MGNVSTGGKGDEQGWAVLGRWSRVLLPRVAGRDSRNLWGKTTSQHQPPSSSSGALPKGRHRGTHKDKAVMGQPGKTNKETKAQLYCFVRRQHRQQTAF